MPSWLAVLPPLLAVFLAIVTRRMVLSLLFGIAFGALIVNRFNPFLAIYSTVADFLLKPLFDSFHGTIFVFTASIIAMVAVMTRAGGIRGVIDHVVHHARNARAARIWTAAMGGAIFFDDYANTMVIGTTMRPLTDRYRISREKLAYLVDSTAAPVAALAIISTWIGYQNGLIGDVFADLSISADAYGAFIQMIPLRFYCLFTLAFVALNVFLSRDFGAMFRAEHRSAHEGKVLRDGAKPMTSQDFEAIEVKPGIPARWYNAFLPILVVVGGTIGGLLLDGGLPELLRDGSHSLFSFSLYRTVLANTQNSNYVLAGAGVAGLLCAILLALGQRLLGLSEALRTVWDGCKAMYLAFVILILAWGLASVTEAVGTAHFLYASLGELVPPLFLPLLTFVLASLIAFSTGSSWTTMALLLPTLGPLAWHQGGMPMIILTMAAVLDGAIFGDHCSPVSDTTILSSIASSCDHLDHVRTQMPYALSCMGLALLTGYLPMALGVPLWLCHVLGLAGMVGLLLLFGRNPEHAPAGTR
ncbi:MAG: hypothetical protein A2284_08480 [Deltaproteobacteria bacterium RIFOXYA12_FULL_61_11]|nr:MAG: hypothetical protein A2284_08480 [Deltaproteobacteria bacterium RIFOXYA12_FULL_61_11]